MRIVFTSDLHADQGAANAAILPVLLRQAASLHPDVMMVAGDVADRAEVVGRTLEAFREVGALRLYVAGNHDLYAELDRDPILDSRTKFEQVLPRVATAAGFEYLGLDPVRFRTVTFVGTPGWWDYSLRDPGMDPFVSLEQYRAGVWRHLRAFDRGHVLWPRATHSDGSVPADHPGRALAPPRAWRPAPALPRPGPQPARLAGDWASDEEICEHMLELLDRQLQKVESAGPMVAAVHVLPCLEAVQRRAFGPSSFHDAGLGSTRFGERLRADPRVRAIVTGHLHRPVDARLGRIPVASRPVGRWRDSPIDLSSRAAACLGVLEVD